MSVKIGQKNLVPIKLKYFVFNLKQVWYAYIDVIICDKELKCSLKHKISQKSLKNRNLERG